MSIQNETFERFTVLLKAVADPTRRGIVFLLRHGGEKTVNDISKEMQLAQPAASQQLRILKDAGALTARKDGQYVYYAVASRRVCDALTAFLVIYQKELKNKEIR